MHQIHYERDQIWQIRQCIQFTLVELLVVIAIISILAAILLPALKSAKDRGISTSCMSQQKQIGLAIVFYANDYNISLPPINRGSEFNHAVDSSWYTNLLNDGAYVKVKQDEWINEAQGGSHTGLWRCPAVPDSMILWGGGIAPNENHGPMQYGWSAKLSQLRRPAQLWLIGDQLKKVEHQTHLMTQCPSCSNWLDPNRSGASDLHHGGSNVCFFDGHAEWREYKELYYTYQNGDKMFAHWTGEFNH